MFYSRCRVVRQVIYSNVAQTFRQQLLPFFDLKPALCIYRLLEPKAQWPPAVLVYQINGFKKIVIVVFFLSCVHLYCFHLAKHMCMHMPKDCVI